MLGAAAWLATGCSGTNMLTMTVTEPAPVELSPDMKRIGTLNRSGLSESQNAMDIMDKVLTAEGKDLDRDGAKEAMAGLNDGLYANSRFEAVVPIEAEKVTNPNFGIFPAPMDWKQVEGICKKEKLDGLFVLEFYDTDTKVDYAMHDATIKTPVGVDIPAKEHEAALHTVIKTGWRIYDSKKRQIVDEYVITEGVTSHGRGINPARALAAIHGRKEAVNTISRGIGDSYAGSILPYRIRVSRDYYVKGSDQFKIAKRKAQTGNWDGAAEHWKRETNNPDMKVAGRAYYNMAIINEINGHLDTAIEWARQSYEDYGNKLALRYLKVLKHRRAQQAALERQEFAAR